jgi:Fe-S-cluster containining protein
MQNPAVAQDAPLHHAEATVNMKTVKDIPVGVKITTDNKCGFCTSSKCCTYITEELETPRSMHDFDHLLWQLSHRDIQAYKDEDGWYLLINNSCTHLLGDGRCGIYEDRPLICREYTNDYCEFDEPAEKGFELFFEDYTALLNYVRKRFKTWHRYAASRDSLLGHA